MKKTRRIALKITAAGCFLMFFGAMLCSCSSDDDPEATDGANRRSMRHLTISSASTGMRKVKINQESLVAAWQKNDQPTYVNLSALPYALYYGLLTSAKDDVLTTLTGDVMCSNADDIAVIFPAVTPVKPAGEDAYFTVNLSGQKGTLDDIGAHYHYAYGVAQGVTVKGDIASGSIPQMKSLLSLCKFMFSYGGNPVDVKSVQIGWGQTGSVGYPNTGKVYFSDPENTHAEGDAPNGPLTITLDAPTSNGVYVALFPCDSKLTFHFTVSDGTSTYTSTKNAKMLEGKYYEVDIALE